MPEINNPTDLQAGGEYKTGADQGASPSPSYDPELSEELHDIIVIGASAGGIEALQKLVRDLPANFPAAVFVVIHTSAESPGLMPEIITAAGPLPATYPKDGEPIQMGHIYVAPPNYHLILERNIIRIVRGPKENRHRPAIDPLFRSAAHYYGSRVIGIILSGMLDDGTFGLLAIKHQGGLAVVQEPGDAAFSEMPTNALKRVPEIDKIVPVAKMAEVVEKLVRLAPGNANEEFARAITDQLKIEDDFAKAKIPNFEILNNIGKPSTIACPDCHGTLWEIDNNGVLRYRCRVGHAYTAQSLLQEHSDALESALYAAMRNLEENASLNRRLAGRARNENNLLSASTFIESAVRSEQQADLIKRVLYSSLALEEQTES